LPRDITHNAISDDSRFACLRQPRRIWAIPAIHAEAERLISLHDQIFDHIQPGDRIVYMGSMIGHGPQPRETLDEILTFRRSVLAIPGMVPDDFIYLRGVQEELWEKLQQIQFAPNPQDVLRWMLDNGMAAVLESYGIKPRSGLYAACEGVMALTRWTAGVRSIIRKHAGHDIFQCQLRRAAFTTPKDGTAPLLFVHAGINPNRDLQSQGDALWWGGQNFNDMIHPYGHYAKVIRGYDPNHAGLRVSDAGITLDAGCGHGGSLICATFDMQGQVLGLVEA
jgi:serine/threonine protein phosphatase 1